MPDGRLFGADTGPTPGDAAATGDPVVTAALAPLATAGDLPLAEQLGVYTAAHEALQTALDAEIS